MSDHDDLQKLADQIAEKVSDKDDAPENEEEFVSQPVKKDLPPYEAMLERGKSLSSGEKTKLLEEARMAIESEFGKRRARKSFSIKNMRIIWFFIVLMTAFFFIARYTQNFPE